MNKANVIKLYVPGTSGHDTRDNTDVVETVERGFCAQFGGCTTFQTSGSWLDETGSLVKEIVNVVTSYVTRELTDRDVEFVRTYGETVKSLLSQDAVLIELPEGVEFI